MVNWFQETAPSASVPPFSCQPKTSSESTSVDRSRRRVGHVEVAVAVDVDGDGVEARPVSSEMTCSVNDDESDDVDDDESDDEGMNATSARRRTVRGYKVNRSGRAAFTSSTLKQVDSTAPIVPGVAL